MATLVRLDETPGAGRLGRHVHHDDRSRGWTYEALTGTRIDTVVWPRYSPILDQGNLGSCTGNAMAGWLGTGPHVANVAAASAFTEEIALQLYSEATKLDKFPGSYPPDDCGSTGLAVAKAAKKLDFITAYRWCFSTDSMLQALQHQPVIVGTVWTTGMDTPDRDGFVVTSGSIRGGHEYLIRGFMRGTSAHPPYLLCDNSWGTSWGDGGSFRIPLPEWERLHAEQADVTVPEV